MGKLDLGKKLLRSIEQIAKEQKAAEKAGDIETAFQKNKELNEAIRSTVNSPQMPRAKPLSKPEIKAYAERMAPQIEGKLTRKEKGAQTIAGKTQQQFKREQDLPVSREVIEGKADPMAPLPEVTFEDQAGGVLLGLPGDPTLARMQLKGIGDVEFERPVTLHGGPRYGDDERLWASNISAASGLMGAGQRASKQFGDVPVYASYMKMPSGFGFAQHYLESLLQYQRPDLLPKQARLELEKDIKKGFVNAQGKRVTFPDFPGFKDMDAVRDMALQDSNLRGHIADRLEKGKLYGLRPAADVQFAASHPELTNLETGASGFTIGELKHLDPLSTSEHPTYSHDIPGKVIGQTRQPIPYDLLYRDQLQLIKQNPKAPEFNTLKLLGARQKIDDQLIDEINEYLEEIRRLTGKKEGGEVEMADGGFVDAQQPDWYHQLGQMMQNPEPTWYDQLGEMMMAEGGAVKMAEGGQSFPIQDPEEEKKRRMMAEAELRIAPKHPALVKLGEGVKGIHEFVSKPFGYENPPAEMISEFLGIPAVGKTLEDIGYGMPLTTGSGMTTNVRPEVAEAALTAIPVAGKAAQVGAKSAAKVGKALAPTAADLLEMQLKKSGMMMGVAPEGKVGKVKAPANEIGFYNPVEKAALNLPRKKGSGDAFLSDLKKQPGVNDERLAELGLDQFRGNPNVTREEIIAATQERRIPLQESVRRARDEAAIEELESRNDEIQRYLAEAEAAGDRRAVANYYSELEDNIAAQKSLKSAPEAKFSPYDYPDYSMPGGTDYREIRVKLPSNKRKMSYEDWRKSKSTEPWSSKGIVGDDFTHESHHGDEPNVLFHLRVANHADAEGKKGLLIDELQSDWHQQGAKKGYKSGKEEQEYIDYLNNLEKRVKESIKADFIANGAKPDRAEVLATNMARGISDDPRKLAKYMGEEEKQMQLHQARLNARSGVPDAPFKNNWYQLGLKRAIKEAADTGMDRVYLTTGKRQIDRYEEELRKNVDAIEYEPFKGENGELMFEISGIKNGKEVINKDNLTYKELEELVGKDMADKMKNNAGESLAKERPNRPDWMRLSGNDLSIGGEGMKQWYDKTYKNYLEKYAKQHGSKLGMTTIAEGEPVYYIDITPQMKESAMKGQSYRKGGTVKNFKLEQELKRYAVGGEIYNTSPDRSDGGRMIIERNGYA